MYYVCKKIIRFDDVDVARIVYYLKFFCLCNIALKDWFNGKALCSCSELINGDREFLPTSIKSTFILLLNYCDIVKIKILKLLNSLLVNKYEVINFTANKLSFYKN